MAGRFARLLPSALLLLISVATARAADEMILVYPGKPGTRSQAKGVLESFTTYVESRAGWPKGTLHADYFNDEAQAEKALEGDNKPAYAILSLPIYLKWKKQGVAMKLLAQSELDKKPTMQFHLLVPNDSKIHALADAKGANIASSYLEDRAFATKILFAGELDATKDVAIIDTKSMTSVALPACANVKSLKDGRRIDALLVDDDQLAGMQGKKAEMAKMRVAWSSANLPTPPVVTFAGANAGNAQALLDVLIGMSGNAPGREILNDLTTTGFRAPNLGAYAAVEKAY